MRDVRDELKPPRKEKPEVLTCSTMGGCLQSKLAKPAKKKKPLNLISKTEQTRIGTAGSSSVKFLTQEPETSQAQELYKHRRVMSKDRQDYRSRMKSNEHSCRNNSDGSKGGHGSRELKKKPQS